MTSKRLLNCLFFLTASALHAAQSGTVELNDGRQINGEVRFTKDAVTVRSEDGKTHSIPIDEMRQATLAKGPGKPDLKRNGLRGRYFANIKHEGTPVERIDQQVNFDWREGSAAKGVPKDGFSVRWEGEVEAPISGEITFEVESDDGSRLWVDGKKWIDHWEAQSATTHSGKIHLEAGRRYQIRLEYYDGWSSAVARLRWKGEGLGREIIPANRLFPLPLNSPDPDRYFHEVKLKSGSTLSGTIGRADSKRVHLDTPDGTIIIPAPAIGYMRFSKSWNADLGTMLARKPAGVAFLNRDFAEGKFQEFKDGKAKIESVLFGSQSIPQGEIRAIKLTDQRPKPSTLWILTTSDRRILVDRLISLPDGKIKIRDNSGYHLTIPSRQIRQVRRSETSEPG